VVELANVLERFLELVVIAEPAAHFINLFAAQAELASTAVGIADGQNPQRVPAAAGADRAAAAVVHGPLEQRAAQHLPCHRQLADKRLARGELFQPLDLIGELSGLYRDGEYESDDEPVVEATYTVKSMAKPKRGRSTVATDNHVGGRIRKRRIMVGLTQQRLARNDRGNVSASS
jgi:hypothetical protein